MPGGNKPGQVHHHKWEDNAYMIKIYRQSRILVVYQFECQEVAGKLFWVPIKACQWNHLTLLAEAQAQPPYYSTDYPWSSFLGTKSSEDPLLCSSQPTRFVEWFRQRWGNLHATTWRRSHYNQIVIDSTKVVATCIQQEFFDHTYPIFQVRLKDTAFTEGDEANFIPVYSPHQMLVIYNFRVSTARPSTDRRKQQSGITSEQGMGVSAIPSPTVQIVGAYAATT